MSRSNIFVFLTAISIVGFVLGIQAHRITDSQSASLQTITPVSADSPELLTTLNPTFPKVPIRLQPPVINGTDLDQDFIQIWLSDRSPEAFLTFDDGPSEEATNRILDLLQKHDVKATFFVLGRNVVRLPEVVRRIVAEGHELALHSYTHPNLLLLTREQKEAEIAESLSLLHWDFPDLRIRWFRPPYGKYDQEVADIVHAHGMCIALFNEISIDHTSTIEDVARVVLNGRGKVMVFHDGQWPRSEPLTPAEANLVTGLDISIETAKAQGINFRTLSSHFDRFCP